MYADAYLAQTDGAYSAACGRRVPSRQKPQAPSMTSGLLRRTGSRPCSRPAGSLSVLFFGGVRGGGLPGGGEPSALRWMAAKAEFPCGLPGGGGPSALRWMAAGAEFSCGVLGGGESSVVWWMAAGGEFPCGLSGGCVASALWWMQWWIGGFCRRVFVDFCWWGGYTESTYLGTFWAVRLSDPHMVGCINMAGRSRLVV